MQPPRISFLFIFIVIGSCIEPYFSLFGSGQYGLGAESESLRLDAEQRKNNAPVLHEHAVGTERGEKQVRQGVFGYMEVPAGKSDSAEYQRCREQEPNGFGFAQA